MRFADIYFSCMIENPHKNNALSIHPKEMKLGLNASEAYKTQLWWAFGHYMKITTDSVKKGNLGHYFVSSWKTNTTFSQILSNSKLEITVSKILNFK